MNAADAVPDFDAGPEPDNHPRISGSCSAWGCPCRGTRSQGGEFMCSWHARVANVADLQDVTAALNRERSLIALIGELQALHNFPGKGAPHVHMAMKAFAHDEHMQPNELERAQFGRYLWRLREELAFRCGLIAGRPDPQVPMGRTGLWAGTQQGGRQ